MNASQKIEYFTTTQDTDMLEQNFLPRQPILMSLRLLTGIITVHWKNDSSRAMGVWRILPFDVRNAMHKPWQWIGLSLKGWREHPQMGQLGVNLLSECVLCTYHILLILELRSWHRIWVLTDRRLSVGCNVTKCICMRADARNTELRAVGKKDQIACGGAIWYVWMRVHNTCQIRIRA